MRGELTNRTPTTPSALAGDKRRLLEELLRREGLDPSLLPIPRRESGGERARASFAQIRLWFLDQLAPGSPVYNLHTARRLRGSLDAAVLERALDEVVRRHEALRTAFDATGAQPVQVVAPHAALRLPRFDLWGLPAGAREAEARRVAEGVVRRPFALSRGPLFRPLLLRLAEDDHVLILAMHHVVADGWSIGVLYGELLALYAAFVVGAPSPLRELPIQYADFAEWQHGREAEMAAQLDYWRGQLAGLPGLELVADRSRPAVQSYRGGRLSRPLSGELVARLRELGRRAGATLYIVLLAAFEALLHRYTDQDDFAVGCPIANRNRPELEPLIGFFVNTLVLRAQLAGHPRFAELLDQVKQTTFEAYAHQDLPFERLVEALRPERDLSRQPLVQVLFHLQSVSQEERQTAGLTWTVWEIDNRMSTFDLTVNLWETPGEEELECQGVYAADLFEGSTVEQMLRHFVLLLEGIVEDPERRLWDIVLLDLEERRQLLAQWDHRMSELYPDTCLHRLFESWVDRQADVVAVSCEGVEVSYGELDRRANRVAHGLLGLGLAAARRVAVLLPSAPQQVAALLGVLKAGCAFVCLDPRQPTARLAQVLAEASAGALLTDASSLRQHPALAQGGDWLVLDLPGFDALPATRPLVEVDPAQPAYVAYTSGSTGRPKGIVESHRSFSQFVLCQGKPFSIQPHQRFAQWASCGYDASYCEIFGALCLGATLCMAEPSLRFDPAALAAWLRAEQVTLLQVVPSFAQQLLQSLGDGGDGHPFPALAALLLAGEAVRGELATSWLERFPATPRLFNLYGPSETVLATWHPVLAADRRQASVPVGRAFEGRHVVLLDRHSQPAPRGVPGEIHVRSAHLADGYLDRPAETAGSFVPDAWGGAGERLYRTGDLGRWLPDSSLVFLRRRDQQVKVRGNRVELGEIEAALRCHPAVEEAAVAAHDYGQGDLRLVAYVTLDPLGSLGPGDGAGLRGDYIAQTRSLYDEIYALDPAYSAIDGNINTRSWTSSYTHRALPEAEVLESIEDSVARILALRPGRVLEIGAGTGLLLFRVAPHCAGYLATDISETAVGFLRRRLASLVPPLPGVAVERRAAHELGDLPAGSFDTVVFNLVTQHFPDEQYLREAVAEAVRLTAPGGAVFVGGVRSLPLLRAFHASVQLAQATDPGLGRAELRRRVEDGLLQDKDLVIDPALFAEVVRALPRVSHLRVLPKGGRSPNEINCFQYDAILRLEPAQPLRRDVSWRDWRAGMDLESLRRHLADGRPEALGFTGVPNVRLAEALRTAAWLDGDGAAETVGDLRQALAEPALQDWVDPADLWDLTAQLPYDVELLWTGAAADGSFDLVLQSRPPGRSPSLPRPVALPAPPPAARRRELTNKPLRGFAAAALPQLGEFLRARLPEPMVPSAFVQLAALPRTVSGKIDRHALEKPAELHSLAADSFEPPRTELEQTVAEVWQGVLRIERAGRHDNFFDLGGHSLLATQVLNRLRSRHGVEIPLRRFLEAPTIAATAHQAEELLRREGLDPSLLPIAPRWPAAERARPSFAQVRLWFLDQLAPGSAVYNLHTARRLRGSLDVAALERALNEIVRRHEVLRTAFDATGGQPVQVIAPYAALRLPRLELRDLSGPAREAEARRVAEGVVRRPFALTCGPLFRSLLLRLGPEDHVLILSMHHVVADGWSIGVLYGELLALYAEFVAGAASPLAALPIQYADFAEWQHGREAEMARQLEYWRGQLAGLPGLELVADRSRPAVQSYRGGRLSRLLSRELVARLRDLGRREGATLYIVLLAAFQALLHRYTDQDDFAVGCPIANRNRPELESLIGFFVNTLVLRVQLDGHPRFGELLAQTKKTTFEAYAHQDLPFERLVEALRPERDLSRQPLIQVLFHQPATQEGEQRAGGVHWSVWEIDNRMSTFDLTVNLWETPGEEELECQGVYAADLFEGSTVEQMLRHFVLLLEGIVADPERCLWEIALLDAEERRQLLTQWDHRLPELYPDTCLHRLFESWADRQADVVAVSCEGVEVSYGELDRRANRVTHGLLGLGLGAARRVAVLLPSAPQQVAALLGVLKAGCAFVCLDPRQPTARLAQVLAEASAGALLTDVSSLRQHPALAEGGDWPVVDLAGFDALPATRSLVEVDPAQPAYIAYTSGSTGRPKGIVESHRSFSQFVLCQGKPFAIAPHQRFAQWASCGYDASYCEIFGALCLGATLCMAEPSLRFDPAALAVWLCAEQVTLLQVVPSFAQQLLQSLGEDDGNHPFPALAALLLAGEAVRGELAASWLERFPATPRLYNLYGPSETVLATWHPVLVADRRQASVPVGRAFEGRHVVLLDRHGQPAPRGVPGEIHVRSAHLADGYLDRPAETAASFVPDALGGAGGRLYRTGDLGRWLPDGSLVFLRRRDQQVKVRGNRVELGEVEAALRCHPAVEEAAVAAHDYGQGDLRLVAYVALDPLGSLGPGDGAGLRADYIEQTRSLYDEIYALDPAYSAADNNINTRSWTSSYTHRALPEAEVIESIEDSVERILALRPRRVLEIGAGTGLLLFRVAPHCAGYLATDISETAVGFLRRRLASLVPPLPGVAVERRAAHELSDLPDGSFDTVVFNLVTQHFPDEQYLREAVAEAVRLTAPGGAVFVGGVRSLPLLRAFHASVQLAHADPRLDRAELRRRVEDSLLQDKDLVIDPALFAEVVRELPRPAHLRILPKGGRSPNEINRFQYDAILRLEPALPARRDVAWRDWRAAGMDLESLRRHLADGRPEALGFTGVPNVRLAEALRTAAWLDGDGAAETVGDLRQALAPPPPRDWVDPADLWDLTAQLPYSVELLWTGAAADGSFDLVLQSRPPGQSPSLPRPVALPAPPARRRDLTNKPLRGFAAAALPQLGEFLRARLPEPMVPSAFVQLAALPRTVSGKIDRHALEKPAALGALAADGFEPPSGELEQTVAEVWRVVLRIERAGRHDNFFDLGGHSLLATQVLNRLRSHHGVEIPLRRFLEAPTIAATARQMEESRAAVRDEDLAIAQILSEVRSELDHEVQGLLR